MRAGFVAFLAVLAVAGTLWAAPIRVLSPEERVHMRGQGVAREIGLQSDEIYLSGSSNITMISGQKIIVGDSETPLVTVQAPAFQVPMSKESSTLIGRKCEWEGQMMHNVPKTDAPAEICFCVLDPGNIGMSYRCANLSATP